MTPSLQVHRERRGDIWGTSVHGRSESYFLLKITVALSKRIAMHQSPVKSLWPMPDNSSDNTNSSGHETETVNFPAGGLSRLFPWLEAIFKVICWGKAIGKKVFKKHCCSCVLVLRLTKDTCALL